VGSKVDYIARTHSDIGLLLAAKFSIEP